MRRFLCAEKSHQLSVVGHQWGVTMLDFRNLMVWQKAHDWVLNVYKLTKRFPDDERFGLTSQLRRAAASISANLAEGCGRSGSVEFGRFVQIAMGSATEAEYHIVLATDLGFMERVESETTLRGIQEIKLTSLLETAREKSRPPRSRGRSTEN
jgi:four helix bundle protein